MFRVSNPWDGWMRPSDDDAYPFVMPASHVRASAPFEGFGFDHPDEYGYPAYRTGRRHPTTPAAFFPGYPRQPRHQTFFPTSTAPHDPYDSLIEPLYGLHYPRRAAATGAPFYMAPVPAQGPPRVAPHPAAGDANPSDMDDEQDENGIPFLLHNGYVLKRPGTKQTRQQQQPVVLGKPQPLAPTPLTRCTGGGSKAVVTDSASHSDADDADGNDHIEHRHTLADTGRASRRAVQPQPVLIWDPRTGRSFRAVVPAAVTAATTTNGSTLASKGDGSKDSTQAPAKESLVKPQCKSTAAFTSPAPAAAAAAAASAASPSRANTAPAARGSTAAGSGPTRIQVRSADSNGSAAAKVPIIASDSGSPAKATGPKATSTDSAATAFSSALERQNSTALVTRPPLEVALSRGPSAVLPSAVATVAASASGSSAAHAAVSVAATASECADSTNATDPKAARSKGPIVTATTTRMTRSMAARTIQRWWRGWRLWRNKPALKVLMALSTELRNAAALFQQYLDSTNGNLTDMQQLEVNELAMRAILKLDSLEGLPQELRVLRKHLTARALRLQDEVHSAYARSTTRPAQVRHGVPAPPAAAVAAQNCTVDADGAETVTAAATPVEEGLATPEISVACDGVAAAATEEAVVEGPGASGCPSPASVASQGDQDSLSGGEGAATTACTRAAHRHSKRVRTKRGGGIDDRSISSSAGKRRSAPVSRSRGDNLNISRISGRLFQRLRRRFGASAAAVAVAAAAAAAAHLPPAASSRRGGSQGFGLDACGLRKQPRGAHKKQQQQSQQPQQQSVIVRVVVRPDAGVDGNIEEDIRSCRTALLVESGVQTD
ncbi:hypothetical protein Vretimale_3015 [Volvox reticuliferus]|uniref:BAG domain-containing protein n=1 Tax=Volvox reticuliferus TaxID=1737510 RepID=A0A8J4D7N3_9CHLO|nr:hypothetical protein Vretifemale_6817 [Volvox reticuliferus]GIL97362.1 hypothetical protein Vretimale_3015 [Volvox reticuliferus]